MMTSILANGGWCQLHHSNNVALINVVGGRLLSYNKELSFIERFDLQTDKLDGYFVILNETKQRLKKANWIKKILTIGGKTIHDSKFPETLNADTLHEFLFKLKTSQEIYNIRLIDGEATGRTLDFSDSELTLEIISTNKISENMRIHFADIVCFELRIQKLKQLGRHERRLT
jgi:hypothetical protein